MWDLLSNGGPPSTVRGGRVGGARRKRVLLFAEAVTLAHAVRPYVLAQSLPASDYEVILASDPRFDHLLPRPPGTRRIAVESIASEDFAQALLKGKPHHSSGDLERYVARELDLFDELRPDLVVGDLRLSLYASTRLAGLPYANLCNAYWSPYARSRFALATHPLARWIGIDTVQRVFERVRPLAFAYFAETLHRVCRRHRIAPPAGGLAGFYTAGDYTLYADTPTLVPTFGAPATHRYLGPISWAPEVELPPWWQQLPTDRPLVYVSPGSSGELDWLPLVLSALQRLGATAVVSTAGRTAVGSGEGVYVADFLPGPQVAERADVVVSNGGSPTSYQALAQGTPVLGIASNLDQMLCMDHLVGSGAGRLIRRAEANPRLVTDCLGDLLEDSSHQVAARRLQASLGGWHAGRRFREFVDQVLSAAPGLLASRNRRLARHA